jgi:NADH-quinone oxidoreductase subunit N
LSAPFLWIVLPILISLSFLFFRKFYFWICLSQIVFCFLLTISAGAARFLPAENSSFFTYEISPEMNILGRSLIITSGLKTTLMLFYGFLGFWSVSLYLFKIKSNIVPLGLAFVGLLIAALAVEPFLYSALILEIAVIISIPVVAKIGDTKIKGVSRYLIYFTIGMPFILLAGWYLSGGEITPVNNEQLVQAALLLGLGFVFWLAVFPFQSWVPLFSDETEPYEGLFILILLPVAVFVLLLKYLDGFAWLRGYDTVFQALRLFGLLMIIMGSIWFSLQNNLRKALGYLVLVSSGLMIICASLNSSNGYIISTYFILLRLISFFALTWILVAMEKDSGILKVDSLKDLFSKAPLLATGFFISLFSLIGMPLSAGFSVMQSFLSELAVYEPRYIIFVIISLIILSITIIRWLFISLTQSEDIKIYNLDLSQNIFFISCLLVLLLIGIFPNFIYPRISEIANELKFLVK